VRKGSFLSRAAALLLLLLCFAMVGVLVVEPVISEHRTLTDRIATAQDQRDRFAARQQDIKSLQSEIERLKRSGVTRTAFLREKSEPLAAAALLGRVKQTVQRHGGTLASSQILRAKAETEEPRVTVRAQMKASPKALQHIFHQLESAQPALFLGNVLITGRTLKRTLKRRGKVQQSWDELILDVQYDVTGYLPPERKG